MTDYKKIHGKEISMPPAGHVFPADLGYAQPAQAVTQQEPEHQSIFTQSSESLYDLPAPDEADQVEEVVETSQTQQQEYEQDEEVEEVEQVTASRKQPKTQQENFKEVRLAKERAERERDALMSQMLNMQSQLQNQPKQQAAPVVEEKQWYDDIDPESLIEGKQFKQIAQDLKAMKNQLRDQQQKAQEFEMQNKIRAQYPDIDSVVNGETIKALNEQYPVEAAALGEMSNRYSQAVLAYTTIKNLGLYKPQGNALKKPAYESEVLRAKVNAAKPRPLTSVNPQQGDSPLSKANAFANGFTEEVAEALRKEMYSASKKY